MSVHRPVRGLGAAKSGTSHFIRQRVTGMFNVLGCAVIGYLVVQGSSYDRWVDLLSSPWLLAAAVVSLGSAVYHMVLGMQVVIEDYVHSSLVRTTLLIANRVVGSLVGVAGIVALLRLGITGG